MKEFQTPKALLDALSWRAAVKLFDPNKKLDAELEHALLESLRLAPSAYGLQPWKFIVVSDPETRKNLRAVAFDQPKVTDAPLYIVIAVKNNFNEHDVDEFVALTAQVQGKSLEDVSGLKRAIMGDTMAHPQVEIQAWAEKQCYIPLGMLIAAAAVTGVDAGPMEGFLKDKYDEILDLKIQNLHALVAIAIGYRSEDDTYQHHPKVRFPAEKVFITK